MKIGLLASLGKTIDAFFPDIVKHWESLGHEVFTGASTTTHVGTFKSIEGLTREPRPSNISVPGELRRWVENTGVEVVVSNTATVSALSRVRRLPVPLVYFCHGLHWNTGRSATERVWQAAEKMLLRNTEGVITINEDDNKWFSKRFSSDRLIRLDEGVGVPLDEYDWTPVSKAKPSSLLWAGEFSNRKRPWLALEVVKALREICPNVSLTMIGDGALRDATVSKVADLGLEDVVSVPGPQPFREVLPDHAALLHTAEWEGLPRVGLEAAVMGRRTFAFDVKGVRDLPGAYLAREGDIDLLVAGLAHCLGSAGRERGIDATVRDGLSAVSAARKIEEFLQKIVLAR